MALIYPRHRAGMAPRLVNLCLMLGAWCSVAWSAPPASEYQVKAVYLFNFVQFVEWPGHAYDSPTAPFVIGVVGEDPFGDNLDRVVAGESLGSHQLVVKRFSSARDISNCNILFIG